MAGAMKTGMKNVSPRGTTTQPPAGSKAPSRRGATGGGGKKGKC